MSKWGSTVICYWIWSDVEYPLNIVFKSSLRVCMCFAVKIIPNFGPIVLYSSNASIVAPARGYTLKFTLVVFNSKWHVLKACTHGMVTWAICTWILLPSVWASEPVPGITNTLKPIILCARARICQQLLHSGNPWVQRPRCKNVSTNSISVVTPYGSKLLKKL